MQELRQKFHGLPGLGTTGQRGREGSKGIGTHVGCIDEFFIYNDTSINYLNSNYREGDILYFYKSKDSSYIKYMTYITKDLEKCTKLDLIDNAIESPFNFYTFKPYTINSSLVEYDDHLMIVGGYRNDCSYLKLHVAHINSNTNFMLNANEVVKAGVKETTEIRNITDTITKDIDGNPVQGTILKKYNSFFKHPIYYDPSRNLNYNVDISSYIYNGDEYISLKYSSKSNLAYNLIAKAYNKDYLNINTLAIGSQVNTGAFITVLDMLDISLYLKIIEDTPVEAVAEHSHINTRLDISTFYDLDRYTYKLGRHTTEEIQEYINNSKREQANLIARYKNVNLKISNLYIKNDNIGNIDSYDVVINNGLYLDDEGHSYTLCNDDYDSSTYIFTIDTSKLFIDKNVPDNYHHGYIHMYWNYNDSSDCEWNDTSVYKINNIFFADTVEKERIRPYVDENGNYVRLWNDASDVLEYNIKEILSNTLDTSILGDVLPDDLSILEPYINSSLHYGILKSEKYNTLELVTTTDTLDYTTYDSSYESSVIYVTDPSINKIQLNIIDSKGNLYRHHDIVHWVMNDKGIKFYSKHTKANYDSYTNTFIIDASDNTTEIKEVRDLGIVTYDVNGLTCQESNCLVDITSSETLSYHKTYVDDASRNSISWAKISITNLGDSKTIAKVNYNTSANLPYNCTKLSDVLKMFNSPNTLLFDSIYDSSLKSTYSRESTVATQYALENSDIKYVAYTKVRQPGYTEARTIPKIHLYMHNDLEDIEQLNKNENGILSNQVQFFLDVSISDFDNSNWGKYSEIATDTSLSFTILNITTDEDLAKEYSTNAKTRKTFLFIKDLSHDGLGTFKSSIDIINQDTDIYNATMSYLNSKDAKASSYDASCTAGSTYSNLSPSNSSLCNSGGQQNITLSFKNITIDKASKGKYRARILLEYSNPIPTRVFFKFKVTSLTVSYKIGGSSYAFSASSTLLNNLYDDNLYQSAKLDALICPISYTLIPETIQSADDYPVKLTTLRNYLGSEDNILIGMDIYNKDIAEDNFNNTSLYNTGLYLNWNTMNIKRRYFQDNIQNITIKPININDVSLVIDTTLLNKYKALLVDDPDDIERSYLSITYNANLLQPRSYNDEISFIYNGSTYLASKYSQLSNNTAIFVEQQDDYEVRNSSILNSIEYWNIKYNDSSKLKGDNVFAGHLEAYGNGYNYLNSNKDNGEYPQKDILSLLTTQTYNENYIFTNGYYGDIDYPEKTNVYQPDSDKLYRTLLYNIRWQYPKYTYNNIDDYNTINTYNIHPVTNDASYPYNLAYSIYPRSLYNDEDKINIILMLRCPSVVKENQYQMTTSDICLKTVAKITSVQQQENPLNTLY